MVEFSNDTNYSYVLLNNDTIQNQTNNLALKKKLSYSFEDLVILVIDIFIVVGPSLGYFMQTLKFKKTKSSKGFSKSICLIIYTSQILRVFFWIGKPFKITLLYQSILIIVFQIYLIHLWVKYHQTFDKNKSSNENQVNEFNIYEKKELIEYLIDWSDTISPNKIWNWSSQIEYYKFMSLIVFILLLICGVVGIHNVFLTNLIGTISVISESSTLIPQIIVSCKTKNPSNLSTSMVALWLIGDSCKFVYNIKYKTPIQMIISGGVTIFLDFFSLMQIICYKDKKKLKKKEIRDVEITNSEIKQKEQQINQFMKRLDTEQDEKNNEDNNNSDTNKNVNKIEVIDKNENSDKVEVLDKSKDDQIKYPSDDEEDNNKNNIQEYETNEEYKKDEDNMANANLNEEGENENKIDEN